MPSLRSKAASKDKSAVTKSPTSGTQSPKKSPTMTAKRAESKSPTRQTRGGQGGGKSASAARDEEPIDVDEPAGPSKSTVPKESTKKSASQIKGKAAASKKKEEAEPMDEEETEEQIGTKGKSEEKPSTITNGSPGKAKGGDKEPPKSPQRRGGRAAPPESPGKEEAKKKAEKRAQSSKNAAAALQLKRAPKGEVTSASNDDNDNAVTKRPTRSQSKKKANDEPPPVVAKPAPRESAKRAVKRKDPYEFEETDSTSSKDQIYRSPSKKQDVKVSNGEKENKLSAKIGSSTSPKPTSGSTPSSPKRSPTRGTTKNGVTGPGLEDEDAEEDSAMSPKPGASAAAGGSKDTMPKKRIMYDQESVLKGAQAVIDNEMSVKKASEKFKVSEGAINRRVRLIKHPPPPKPAGHSSKKRRLQAEADVEVIRVEDLD